MAVGTLILAHRVHRRVRARAVWTARGGQQAMKCCTTNKTADMSDIGITFLLIAALFVILGSGVWIGLTLSRRGLDRHAAVQQRARPARRWPLTIWGSSVSSWTLTALAAVRLDGRDPVPHAPERRTCSAAWRPWMQALPGRLLHVNVVGCAIFAAVSGSECRHLRDDRQDEPARAEAAAAIPDGISDRQPGRRRHAGAA